MLFLRQFRLRQAVTNVWPMHRPLHTSWLKKRELQSTPSSERSAGTRLTREMTLLMYRGLMKFGVQTRVGTRHPPSGTLAWLVSDV